MSLPRADQVRRVCVLLAAVVLVLLAVSSHAQTTQPHPTSGPAVAARDPLSGLPSYGEMLRRTFYALLAIVGCLVLAAKILPRWLGHRLPTPKGKMIEVVEFHRLEPRKGVYLLRVAGQYLLVGSSEGRLETLAGGPLDQQKLDEALRPTAANAASTGAASPAHKPEASDKPNLPFIEVLRGKRQD